MSLSGFLARRRELEMRSAAARTLVAVCVGIALSRVAAIPWWLCLAVVVLAVALTTLTRGLTLYLALAVCALVYAQARAPRPVDHRLYSEPGFQGVVTPAAHGRAVVSLTTPWQGKVFLYLKDSSVGLRPGDLVRVSRRIRPLDRPRNPGVADYNSILAGRGFVGKVSAAGPDIMILARRKGPLVPRLIGVIRQYILGTVERLLPGNEGALLLGLLLGGGQDLPQDVKEAFSDAGIVHILAVSGMNVSIVVGLIWLTLALLGVRGWQRFGAGALGVAFYVLLVGWSAAPARAGIMACALLLSGPTQRRVTPVASLCAAGILLLVIEPAMLFELGAQLSFAATMGIVLAATPAERWLVGLSRGRRQVRQVLVLLMVSLSASLATAPLLLHHFSRVQLLGFLTSTAVVPLVGLAMPLGVVALLSSLVSPWLTATFAQSLWLVLTVLLKLTEFMGRLDWAIWEPGRWSWLMVGWAYMLGLLALRLHRARGRVAFVVLLLGGLSVLAWYRVVARRENSVTFLDPGQGDAVLFEDGLGRKLLVDAGVTGPGALRDYLRSRGIHNLDVVVVTHPDKDHYGGLLDLPERFRIGQLLTPVTESPDPDFNALLTSLRARGTNITVVGKGTRLSGLGFEVQFLWPDDVTRNRFRLGTASTNDLSLVALVKHAEFRMLLTGDLDDPELLTSVAPRADLLKSPHHGSRKGNPVSLYEQVQPDFVLVMGRYPTPAKLGSRFAGTRVCYINTRSEGAVTLRFRGGTAQVQRFFPRPACAGE